MCHISKFPLTHSIGVARQLNRLTIRFPRALIEWQLKTYKRKFIFVAALS